MVVIFPKLCLWRRSLCSNLGGIDPEKLYRATLNSFEIILRQEISIYTAAEALVTKVTEVNFTASACLFILSAEILCLHSTMKGFTFSFQKRRMSGEFCRSYIGSYKF